MHRLDNVSQYIRGLEELRAKLRENKSLGAHESTKTLGLVIRALEQYRDSQGQFVLEPFPLKQLEELRAKLRENKSLGAQENVQTLGLVIRALEQYRDSQRQFVPEPFPPKS